MQGRRRVSVFRSLSGYAMSLRLLPDASERGGVLARLLLSRCFMQG